MGLCQGYKYFASKIYLEPMVNIYLEVNFYPRPIFSPKNLTLIENVVFEVSYSFVYFYVLSLSTFIEVSL